jgi:hypothetical protein
MSIILAQLLTFILKNENFGEVFYLKITELEIIFLQKILFSLRSLRLCVELFIKMLFEHLF